MPAATSAAPPSMSAVSGSASISAPRNTPNTGVRNMKALTRPAGYSARSLTQSTIAKPVPTIPL